MTQSCIITITYTYFHVAKVHCEWDDWKIGKCSKPCGGGTQTNTRKRKKEASYGGKECSGAASITKSCNIQECKGKKYFFFKMKQLNNFAASLSFAKFFRQFPFPVDCKWSSYGAWTACSATCNGGIKTSTRTIKQKAMYGGKACKGKNVRKKKCNSSKCPGNSQVNGIL